MPNVVQYVGHRPAHILVWNRRDRPRRFYRVGQKVRKNFEFLTISRLYVHISQKLLKTETYKQYMQKGLSLPYPTVASVWTNRSRVSTGWAKNCDVIPVLRIPPRATEPSTVSVSLSSVRCGRICSAQTCAHSGIQPSTLAKGFQKMGQKFEKNSHFGPFLSFTSPIYQWPLKIQAHKPV